VRDDGVAAVQLLHEEGVVCRYGAEAISCCLPATKVEQAAESPASLYRPVRVAGLGAPSINGFSRPWWFPLEPAMLDEL
jgi:hypothetical protein